jgi:exopolysaccharide production protein ExoQ
LTTVPRALRQVTTIDGRQPVVQVAIAIAIGLAAGIVAATMDPAFAVILGGGFALVLIGLRWPLVPLFIFVALVPIEEAVAIPGLGTLSRYAGLVFAVVYALPRLGRLAPGAFPPAAWAYLGWATLSTVWALSPDVAQGELQTLLQLAIIGFLIADVVIHDPTVIRPLLWAYSITATLSAAIGIASYAVGGVDVRAAAIANQNPAQFASLLLPAFIFALNELLHGRRIAASAVVSLLTLAGIVVSGTRSVWVAAGVVVFMLLLPRLGIRRAIASLVVVMLLLVAVLQLPGVGAMVADRADTAASSGGAGRTDIWAVGYEIFSESPIIGVGYANFPVAFTASVIRSANVTYDVGAGRGPHNVVVGTVGELGIVGIALLALFVLPLALRRGWGPDAAVVQAIVLSLMIDALFIDILGNRKQVWIAIGMAAGLAYLRQRSQQSGDATEPAGTAGEEPAFDSRQPGSNGRQPGSDRRQPEPAMTRGVDPRAT